ncbi:hypothetical protein GCM10007424_01440 [Flavobacterium suaedae]|uniref:Lipocalin-like domain-containing protein n=1 Tax=Flavobacterium suaedae TaxID=1767027 RepID=A0ABQ1JF28_9FLAO|nr:DUF5004 domain-containing protein [Flavobacterium suaedae]GGB65223.1 hypothetical protein GCM10007424_01440 [Flavobacterium suaedae]
MKKIVFLLTLLFLTVSCSDDDDNKTTPQQSTIIGTWQLVEVYFDPGDGSGDFTAVDSDKTITFNTDATVSSNGDLCTMEIEASTASSGTYSENDNTLNLNCNFSEGTPQITYEINGSYLILNYPCIEACQIKYSKVN